MESETVTESMDQNSVESANEAEAQKQDFGPETPEDKKELSEAAIPDQNVVQDETDSKDLNPTETFEEPIITTDLTAESKGSPIGAASSPSAQDTSENPIEISENPEEVEDSSLKSNQEGDIHIAEAPKSSEVNPSPEESVREAEMTSFEFSQQSATTPKSETMIFEEIEREVMREEGPIEEERRESIVNEEAQTGQTEKTVEEVVETEVNNVNEEKMEVETQSEPITEAGSNVEEAKESSNEAEQREAECEKELEDEMIVHGEMEIQNQQLESKTVAEAKLDQVTPNVNVVSEPTAAQEKKEDVQKAAPSKATTPKSTPVVSRIVPPSKRTTTKTPASSTSSKPSVSERSSTPRASSRPTTSRTKPPMSQPSTTQRSRAPVTSHPAQRTTSVQRTTTTRTQSRTRNGSVGPSVSQSQTTTPKINRKYANVQSKVGSITDHKPSGGNVEIFSQKKEYKAQSKVGSLEKANHVPGGGNVRIDRVKLNFKEAAKPRIDAKSDHTPKAPEKKILSQKLNWSAQSKVGSLENAKHKPEGGKVKILNQKLEWKASSKVGSRDFITHKPGGGNVEIFDERLDLSHASSKVGSLNNANHVPGGGNVKIL